MTEKKKNVNALVRCNKNEYPNNYNSTFKVK